MQITTTTLAKLFGVSSQTIINKTKAGDFKVIPIFGTKRLYSPESILSFMEKQCIPETAVDQQILFKIRKAAQVQTSNVCADLNKHVIEIGKLTESIPPEQSALQNRIRIHLQSLRLAVSSLSSSMKIKER